MRKFSYKQEIKWLNNFIFKKRNNLDSSYLRNNFNNISEAIDFFIKEDNKECDCKWHEHQVCDICQKVKGKHIKDI